MMSKKDFEAIAAALARTRCNEPTDGEYGLWHVAHQQQWRVTRDAIIGVLQYSNPRFDRARFVRATEA